MQLTTRSMTCSLDSHSTNVLAVVLRFYAGFTTDQIADTLGCPSGSVGPWIDRALKKMRKELS